VEREELGDFVGETDRGELVFVAGVVRRRFRGEGEGVVMILVVRGD